MKKHITKKRVALLGVLAVGAITAVGAYAYFTSTGSGTGSATVGNAGTWTVAQTGTSGALNLYPDTAIGTGSIQTKSYHVKNNGSGSQYLTDVKISVAQNDASAWAWCDGDPDNPSPTVDGGLCDNGSNTLPPCTKDDFSVGGSAVGATKTDTALAGTFTAGQDKTTGSVTVQMIDNTLNQDNCQGVTVPLYFYAS